MSKLTKASKPKLHQKPLEFLAYASDNLLCVVRIIKFYLDNTSSLGNKEMYSFFIRYIAPYKPVILKTVARCVLDILGKAELNTKIFWAYFASALAAYNKGF